jgi:uncharacterized protein (UPF0335 family)
MNEIATRNTRAQVRAIVERIQRLEEEIKTINDDKRDVYAEAKGNGFDVRALKAVVSYLRKEPEKRDEHDAIVATYLLAFGIGTEDATRVHAHDGPPLRKSIIPDSATSPPPDEAAVSESPSAPRAEAVAINSNSATLPADSAAAPPEPVATAAGAVTLSRPAETAPAASFSDSNSGEPPGSPAPVVALSPIGAAAGVAGDMPEIPAFLDRRRNQATSAARAASAMAAGDFSSIPNP